jgi:hypothetical protein
VCVPFAGVTRRHEALFQSRHLSQRRQHDLDFHDGPPVAPG